MVETLPVPVQCKAQPRADVLALALVPAVQSPGPVQTVPALAPVPGQCSAQGHAGDASADATSAETGTGPRPGRTGDRAGAVDAGPVPGPRAGQHRAAPVPDPGPSRTPVRFPARGVAARCGAQPRVPPAGARCRLTVEAGPGRARPGGDGPRVMSG
ncbi:unnamed protein product [Coccothraustes coccothraustes]